MGEWQRDARAAGFDLAALTVIADFVAGGIVTIDGAPIEVLPGYWVIPGFLPHDGRVILAAVDRRRSAGRLDESAGDLVGILSRAVADGQSAKSATTAAARARP
jgi:hypothetical protein